MSWTGISSDFKIDLAATRTQQLCDAMTVSKDLMANLLLAASGRGGISAGVAVPMVSLQTGMARRNGMVGAYLDRSPVFVLHITALSYGEDLGN